MKKIFFLFIIVTFCLVLTACGERAGQATMPIPIGFDLDQDGIVNSEDNCMRTPNPSQLNSDDDNQGDACDPDDDNDNILDANDNCPITANTDQFDSDLEVGIGDGVGNACDNCPLNLNAGQQDSNNNGVGDLCDDPDNDNFPGPGDNCPLIFNPDQTDADQDGVGDVCDNCPNLYNPTQRVLDPDACT